MAWVTGYPQTDREIDLMYEAESERMWEEQNHDADWDRAIESCGYINAALEHLEKVGKLLEKARDEVDGLPGEYRIGSLIESFEDLECELEKIRQQFIKGEV